MSITLFNTFNNKSFVTDNFDEARVEIEKWVNEGVKRGDIYTDGVNTSKLFKNLFISKSNYSTQLTDIMISEKKETRSYKEIFVITPKETITLYLELRMSVLRNYSNLSNTLLNIVRDKFISDAIEIKYSEVIANKLNK